MAAPQPPADHRQLARLVIPNGQPDPHRLAQQPHQHQQQQLPPPVGSPRLDPLHQRPPSQAAASPRLFGAALAGVGGQPPAAGGLPPRFLYRTPGDGLYSPLGGGGQPFSIAPRHQQQPSLYQPAQQAYHRPPSPLSPHAPFYPLASSAPPPHVVPGVPVGPYGSPRLAGAHLPPFSRARKAGAGHRTTDSIGPPPKAKLGGANAVVDGSSALKRKKIVIKFPPAAALEGGSDAPLWLRAPAFEGGFDEEGGVAPDVFSKDASPLEHDGRSEVEQAIPEVFLPSRHMWEKLKQDRFEAMMLAQGIDVRGTNDPFVPSPSILSAAARSPGVFGHRHSASLSHSRTPSLSRPTHRASPSVSPALFGRPYPTPPALAPRFSMPSALAPTIETVAQRSLDVGGQPSSGAGVAGPDARLAVNVGDRPGICAPLPRKNVLLHSEFPEDAEPRDAAGPASPLGGVQETAEVKDDGGQHEHASPSYQGKLGRDRQVTHERPGRAPVFIPGGGHARQLSYLDSAHGDDEDDGDWDRASDFSDASFSNPSDEEEHRRLRAQRHAPSLGSFAPSPRTRRAPGDIISNPSDEESLDEEDGNGPVSQEAMSRLECQHASLDGGHPSVWRANSASPAKPAGTPNLNPRAPAFVFGRPQAQAQSSLVARSRSVALGSPVKLGEAPGAARPPVASVAPQGYNAATSAFSNAPSFFTALDRTPPMFSLPAPPNPIPILAPAAPRPFNIAAAEFQPRFRLPTAGAPPDLAASLGPSPFRFAPPPGLLKLPASTPGTLARVGARPLPALPPMSTASIGNRYEGDNEPGKRMRTEGPVAAAATTDDDDLPTGHLPDSSPRKSPRSVRSLQGGSTDRMHVFRMPVGPVPVSPEQKLKQFKMPVSHASVGQADGAVLAPLFAGESPERTYRHASQSPELLAGASWQRSPIPDFGSPPPTLRSHVPSVAAEGTPARPLPTIPTSTPIREVRLSLAGSVITDDEPPHPSGRGVGTPDRRSRSVVGQDYPPSSADNASVYQPVQLEDLVRRIQTILDDKLNSLRMSSGTGVVRLASLHPDAEESLLGRLVAMLEDQGALRGSEEAVRGAIEEGYRVVCERLEGSLTEALRSFNPPSAQDAASLQREAVLNGLQHQVVLDVLAAEGERSTLMLEHLEDHSDKLESLMTTTPVAILDAQSLVVIESAIEDSARGLTANLRTAADVVVDAILPALEEARQEAAGLIDGFAERILLRLDDLGTRSLTHSDIASIVSRIVAEQYNKPHLAAAEERIVSSISAQVASAVGALPAPASLDVDGLVRRIVDASPAPAPVNLAPLTAALKVIKDDTGRQHAATEGLVVRLRETLQEELAALAERDAAARSSESVLAEQLQATEAERVRLSAEVAKLRAAGLEHLALQSKASVAAHADRFALDEARSSLKVAETEKAAALERERTIAGENTEKTKELGKLKIKVSVLEAELEIGKREAGKAQRSSAAFQATVERQLASLISSAGQAKIVEKRNRDLTTELATTEKRLVVAEEKLQSNQRAAAAAAAVSKQAQATLQQRLSEADRNVKESGVKLQETESAAQALRESLDAAEAERHACDRRLADLEDALSAAQADNNHLRTLYHPRPETPRASQQRPPSASSSWASPHPLVQQLQHQARPLSPPASTFRPSMHRHAAAPTGLSAGSPQVSDAPKGAMASMWAPQPQTRAAAGLSSGGWAQPSRSATPVSRPPTVKPPGDDSDGWWIAT